MDRASWLSRNLKVHDRELYCRKNNEGKLCVYRNSTRFETYDLDDGVKLTVARSTPFFVIALTDNWSWNGSPCDWGIEPVLNRLRQIDLWNRDVASEVEENHRKVDESKEREMKNNIEAGLSEMHSTFKKSFSDINTANMDKKPKRRNAYAYRES